MRRRLLVSIFTVVVLTSVVLGLPLMYTAWLWVEENARHEINVRMDRIALQVVAQEERNNGVVVGPLDTDGIIPLIPDGARLALVYPTPDDKAVRLDLGAPTVTAPIVESLTMGSAGSLRMELPSRGVREVQHRSVMGVALIVMASMAAGSAVAIVTARRLADPLRDVAARAARLGKGDFRAVSKRHGIPELDRVSDVLDAATVEFRGRLKREHALVADVSHQLRSRLTAIRLRLDELSVHRDPDVVHEAEEAMAQVDRLTEAIDELIRASRADAAASKAPVALVDELAEVVVEWQPAFTDVGRELHLIGDPTLCVPVTATRLREAVAVLVDNALVHGGGTVTVSVRRAGDGTVRVDVGDEGDGVRDGLVSHIFDRGFSGAGSTGVGLALARALIEADGGRLELQQRRPALFGIFLSTDPPPLNPPSDPR